MAKNRSLSKNVRVITGDVLSSLSDVLLVQVMLGISPMIIIKNKRGTWQDTRVEFDLDGFDRSWKKIDIGSLKRAFYNLKSKGLIYISSTGSYIQPKITLLGRQRIRERVPIYNEKRSWDKKIHMVIYDIPEKKREARLVLREYLHKLSAVNLQRSVYLTPYNPRETLKEFIRKSKLEAQVIISSIDGRDSKIVGKPLKKLINDSYNLGDLDKRYQHFVRKWLRKRSFNLAEKNTVVFEFISILYNDPQLPFDLLPTTWYGYKAYTIYKSVI